MKLVVQVFASLMMLFVLSGCLDKSSSKNVAVLDVEVIIKATKQDEIFQTQIKQADTDLSNQLKSMAAELEKQLADIKNEIGDKPSEEDLAKYQQKVQQSNIGLRQKQELARSKLQQYKNAIVVEWRKKIQPTVQLVAQENGADVVMISSPSIMWFSDSVDITDEVLAKLRKQSNDAPLNDEVSSVESMSDANP